jgi:hypothetical protein
MPPENTGFMVAAYVIVAVIVVGYVVSLLVRIRGQRR